MRTVIQRVASAQVAIADEERAAIRAGLLVLAGFEEADGADDLDWMAGKLVRLRIFPDGRGLMNRSVLEVGGEILVVSQFTLFASTRQGNRPAFVRAARPETAIPLYRDFIRQLEAGLGRPVKTGEFGADMRVSLVNDGPVTIVIDSKQRE
jgi:D-tyrosyl-tRNA(Tyr) deacylase